jgi:transposase
MTPRPLLAVLLYAYCIYAYCIYAYCIGVRSSRQIERRCHEDIAFRVLAANRPQTTSRSRGSVSVTRPRSPGSWSSR